MKQADMNSSSDGQSCSFRIINHPVEEASAPRPQARATSLEMGLAAAGGSGQPDGCREMASIRTSFWKSPSRDG